MHPELPDGLYEYNARIDEFDQITGAFLVFDGEVFYVGRYNLWISFFIPEGYANPCTVGLIRSAEAFCDFMKITFYPLNPELPGC